MPVESDCIIQPSKHPFFLSGPARRGSCFRGYKVLEKGNNFQTLKSRHVPPQSCVALPWSAVFSGPDQHARLWNGANNSSQKSGIVLPSVPKEQPSKKCSRAILNLDWMYKILTWSMSSQLSTRWGAAFWNCMTAYCITHFWTAVLCQSSPAGSFFVGAFCWHPGQCLLPHQLIDHLWERSLSSAKPTCRHLALSCTRSESITCLSCDHGRLNTTTLTARYCENVWNPNVLLWY